MQDIRDALRKIIVARGFNQATIAKRANLTPSKLSATLNKNRKLEAHELFRLCRALEIDVATLAPPAP